ncbi:MAG: hypothetical protein HY302_07640 [Opitutae bacterium]|nr:hypothetical protein [Opitutae bacterium]
MHLCPLKKRISPQSLLIVATLLGILVFHLALVYRGAGLFRDQHLGAAIQYANGSIDLLSPIIVGFNATGTPTPQEIPFWQAATAAVMKVFGPWWGWGNVVSWILFATCVFPFYQLANRHLGLAAARWSTLALLLQPLIILQAGQAGTDGTALAVMIWFVCAMDLMLTSGGWFYCVAAALLAALSATQKLPFFMSAGIVGIGLAACQRPFLWRRWVQLGLVGLIGAGIFFIWNSYASRELGRAEFPFQELRANTPLMKDWYFGSLSYRANLINWIRGGYRVLTTVLGTYAFLPVAFLSLLDARQRLARWWLAGAFVTTLVFAHLVLHHWHYYLMCSPALALLVGGALVKLAEWISERQRLPEWIVPSLGFTILICSAVQGSYASHIFSRDDFPRDVAKIISSHTSPAEKLLIAGGGWGGQELMLSGRMGLTLTDAAFLENPATLARLRSLGYTKLVLLSQSPKRAAFEVIGDRQKSRKNWSDLDTPSSARWQKIFETEDLSIRLLPNAP